MSYKFIDNSAECKEALNDTIVRALEKCGLVAEGYAKKLCDGFKNPTGNLRNHITHVVDEDEPAVYIGVPHGVASYGVYVELGTGKYAEGGGGRPTGWAYQDAKGDWHYTHGQKPQPYLKPAAADHAQQYRDIIEDEMKNA